MLFWLVIMVANLYATLELQLAVEPHATCYDGVILCILLFFIPTVC